MSFQIGKVKGIPIRLHFTLLLVFLLVTWTVATSYMPTFYPGLTVTEYWGMGLAAAVILFVSVLLHELSHSVVAMSYGIRVRQIILFIFGGVSDITEESKCPAKEFKISFAGPATSFVLSGIFASLWYLFSIIQQRLEVVEGVLLYSATINALLGGFNLIPAFPLDGGRILRAALVHRKQDFSEGTRIAINVGIALSYGFMAMGFFILITGDFVSGIWITLIGWFLNSGAQSYRALNNITGALARVRLKDIMNTQFVAVPLNASIREVHNDYFTAHMKSAFPVVDSSGKLVGMVTRKAMRSVGEKDKDRTVQEIAVPRANLVVMTENRKGDDAFMQMSKTGAERVFICDGDGRLIGLLSKTDFLEVAREYQNS